MRNIPRQYRVKLFAKSCSSSIIGSTMAIRKLANFSNALVLEASAGLNSPLARFKLGPVEEALATKVNAGRLLSQAVNMGTTSLDANPL
jgi:hypothetical protein